MSTNVVEFQSEDSIAIIRLNRPEAGNAINEAAIEALETIIRRLDSDTQIRVVIMTGAESNTFCAGGDFKYFLSLDTREKGLLMSRRMQAALNRLWSGPQVFIAAINGKALGGGCELLTACHFRIASERATFAFVQAANGITTGWGGGVRLFHLVGRSEALRLLLTAEPIDAIEASRIGFVNRIAKPDEVMPVALDLARRICKNSRASIQAFLEMARLIYEGDPEAAVRYETESFADRWLADEFRKVMNDFHNSRTST
ncbi:MAG TPA: enoyl-CoA hydratase/isomerase family protein [Pyrinomonadaceae bacterium]|nr:enoyl-CoA hydratase/isomerase family protein [Pyrinomonadaceae bacterium]